MASTPLTSTFSGNFSTNLNSNSSIFRPKLCTPFSINRHFHTLYTYPPQSFLLPKFTANGRSKTGTLSRLLPVSCSYNSQNGNPKPKGGGLDWPILKRWDVPWPWQTVSLTSLACGISFVVTGLIEAQALPYLGFNFGDLTLDEKAELLFVDQGITTAAVLGVLFSLTKSFQPLPDDLYRYDLREPFNLRKGWLLWAGIGFAGALGAIALTGVALSFFNGENPQRETDALVRLLPLIGSSEVRIPTPVAVVISAAVFALAHLTPGEFPQLFVLGTALGLSYAQTRNLLTPITIHSLWNSGVILLLTFLQLQGYDIKELLQSQ
uniref:CAAX prenyl protease 2/Lysostaphin resistance protein A-like domain-containing protein n=1 Tax=Chenopodium quinoa TaxID=63459 RepID=A0A803L1N3_CHEQI